MNPLEEKKNSPKIIFILANPIFYSLLIHFFIPFLFYSIFKKNSQNYSKNDNNIVRLKIIPYAENEKNLSIPELTPHSQKMRKATVKKEEIQSPPKTLEIASQIVESKHADINLNNKKVETPNSPSSTAVPIKNLDLPKSLLNQNIFPKQYRAYFKLDLSENSIFSYSLDKFIPVSEKNSYLDKVIEKAFISKLNNLNKETVIAWLEKERDRLYTLENTMDFAKDYFFIVLEFQEPN